MRGARRLSAKRLFLAMPTVLTLVSTSACTDGVYVNRSEYGTAYSGVQYVQYSAAMGTNQIVVFNSQYPPEPTLQSILSAAQTRYRSNQYRFFVGAPPQDWNGYTILLAFADGVQGNTNLCRNRNQPLRPVSAGKTALHAEYCYGETLVVEANGYTQAVSGPDDPRFAKLVQGVVSALFEQPVQRSIPDRRWF